jgi:PIN domain nuclease of toxin-antitoxin system
MRVLLDTHAFLWWVTDDPRLSEPAREVLADGANTLFLSAASGWEIAIKTALGKLQLPEAPDLWVVAQLAYNGIQPLPVELRHGLHTYHLPLHHRDPFDRILIAQCQLEMLPIVSSDAHVARYQVDVVW